MEFYVAQAEGRCVNENDNRVGPFITLHDAQLRMTHQTDIDCAVIALINGEWCRIEWGDNDYFYKPLNDINAYWNVFEYKEE